MTLYFRGFNQKPGFLPELDNSNICSRDPVKPTWDSGLYENNRSWSPVKKQLWLQMFDLQLRRTFPWMLRWGRIRRILAAPSTFRGGLVPRGNKHLTQPIYRICIFHVALILLWTIGVTRWRKGIIAFPSLQETLKLGIWKMYLAFRIKTQNSYQFI